MNLNETIELLAWCNPETAEANGTKCGRRQTANPDAEPQPRKKPDKAHKKHSPRALRALESYVPLTKEKMKVALDYQTKLAEALGFGVTHNNAPFDVIKGDIAFEVKTIQDAKDSRIHMRKDSRERKEKLASEHNLRIYTVAFDLREAEEPTIYIRRGVGAFAFSQMEKVGTLEGIKNFIRKREK